MKKIKNIKKSADPDYTAIEAMLKPDAKNDIKDAIITSLYDEILYNTFCKQVAELGLELPFLRSAQDVLLAMLDLENVMYYDKNKERIYYWDDVEQLDIINDKTVNDVFMDNFYSIPGSIKNFKASFLECDLECANRSHEAILRKKIEEYIYFLLAEKKKIVEKLNKDE